MKQIWCIFLTIALADSEETCGFIVCWPLLVRGSGVCRSVPVSEIIAVREEEEEYRDDGSWKKIKEMEGNGCWQAFTGILFTD